MKKAISKEEVSFGHLFQKSWNAFKLKKIQTVLETKDYNYSGHLPLGIDFRKGK